MSESLLVIVVALWFLAALKTILVASVKPMSKNSRITPWIIIFFLSSLLNCCFLSKLPTTRGFDIMQPVVNDFYDVDFNEEKGE